MGVGARIKVEIHETGARRSVYKWVNSNGSFGGNPLRREIGLGQASKILALEVFWPTTGQTHRFHDVAQFTEMTAGRDGYRKLPRKTVEFRARCRTQPQLMNAWDVPPAPQGAGQQRWRQRGLARCLE